jgi:peptidyl-prolyl cis-trans isomerase SurA
LWSQIVRARFQATVRVDEQDVLAALDSRNGDEAGTGLTATEYTLREVIFIVPEGTSRDQRMREAAAFRSRFESCSTGIASARQLNGVVIQEEIRRFSSDIPADLAVMFDETPVGRLTAPQPGESGVEMIAVCNKREVQSDGDARRDVESELRNEEGVLLSRGYLRDLRASATILRPNR